MKTVSAGLLTHLQSETSTLATCWKATRRDAQVFGYTDHDDDIVYNGVTYQASSGYTPTAVTTSSVLNVDNLDLQGMLDADNITEADLLAGLWDYAAIEIFQVNYADLTLGSMAVRTGTLGNVSIQRSTYIAELRGLTQSLQQIVGTLCEPGCGADLGDTRCGINLATYTFAGSVVSISTMRRWSDSSLVQASGYFTGGIVTWLTGENAGLRMEVDTYTVGVITLKLPMPYTVVIGDTYTISAGCDKSRATCRDTYSNMVNFRGFPDLPGEDAVVKGAA